MGLFGKKRNEEGYIITPDSDNSRYSEWTEQARMSRNPEALTPEQLLGEINVTNDDNEEDEYILDSAEAFEGGTSKNLYEKMLGLLGMNDGQKEDPEEIVTTDAEIAEDIEISLPENKEQETDTETEISHKSSYNPENDEFADFFRSLEQETKIEKVSQFSEADKAYSAPANDESESSVDDLLNRMFGANKAEPVQESVEIEELAAHTEVQEVIAEVEDVITEAEEIPSKEEPIQKEVAEAEEDVKVAPDMELTVAFEAVKEEPVEEIEKTRFIDIPETTHHKPKHSLYDNDYEIDRKAIDDFFDNKDDEQEEKPKKIWGKKAVYEEEPDYEPEMPESVTDVFDDDTDDYDSLDDAARFKDELLTKRRNLTVRMIISIVLTVLMAIVNGSFLALRGLDLGTLPNIANLILLIITIAVNFSTFKSIFKGEFDTDAGTSVTAVIVLIQSIVAIALFDGVGSGMGVLAGLSYCVSLVAKRAVCSATLKSLCIIATNEPKYAVNIIDDAEQSKEIVGNVLEDEEACLCYSKKTINVKGFMKNWSRKTPTDKNIGIQLLVAVLLAIIVTLVCFFIASTQTADLLTVFVIAFCLAFAPSLYLPYSLPTKVMSDGLKYYDSAIGGWNAATALSECNSVVVKAADLFPAGSVILHKMNPLSANRIDTSIAKAAALTIKAESPLANIFKDIIRDQIGNLPKVEDVKYENKLGLSGWVGDERILIGNRTLLENHNVKTPSIDSERAILSAGYMPVYLAIGGIPCVLFVVQYVADPNVKYELCRLCNTDATVIINSTDPNVTKSLICDRFDLYEECIEMMNRNGLNKLREITKPEESTNGFAAYKDNASGYLAILSSAIRIIGVKTMMTVMHIIGIIATLAAFVVLLYTKGLIASAVLLAATFQIVFICITSAIPYINRP